MDRFLCNQHKIHNLLLQSLKKATLLEYTLIGGGRSEQ